MDFGNILDLDFDSTFQGASGGDQLFWDSVTNQIVTAQQAAQIDPSFYADYGGGASDPGTSLFGLPTDVGTGGTGQGGTASDPFTYTNAIKALSGLGALGTLGAAGYGLFGGGSQAPTGTSTTTTQPGALPPGAQNLIGTGASGVTGLGNTGTLAANQFLGALPGAVPQLNPLLQAALGQQATGMAMGQVPALNDPQAQAAFDQILQGQNAQIDYNATNSLASALDLLRARGYAGGGEVFREGAPSAAMGQIQAGANTAKAQAAGNVASQRLQYATQLPQLASQLGGQQLAQQSIPYSALLQGIGTTAGLPLDVLKLLTGQAGTTQTTSATGAQPTFLQQIGNIAPLIGAAGGLLGAAGSVGTNRNTLFGAA